MVDYTNYWSERAETPAKQIVQWIGIAQSKFFDWKKRYGKVNEHNGVLREAGVMDRFNGKKSKKGTGFGQPSKPHDHWHVDISYLNICGTFFFMCSVLDGCSRSIVHWEIREKMEETDVEVILQRAREKDPEAKPRIISDNGPQFISRDFKEFIRIAGMTHVRRSPYYPQSNGKIERYHRTIKSDCIREKQIGSVDDARRVVQQSVIHYNEVRLHSAIG
jgi:transposase InsO family protein